MTAGTFEPPRMHEVMAYQAVREELESKYLGDCV